jgi:hypothetical protein
VEPAGAADGDPGTYTHYSDVLWTLESDAPDHLQLRRTNSGGYLIFGITQPQTCLGVPAIEASNTPNQVHRYSVDAGDTLKSTFCGEGSFSLVTVFDQAVMTQFRCQRLAGNSNICQKVF